LISGAVGEWIFSGEIFIKKSGEKLLHFSNLLIAKS